MSSLCVVSRRGGSWGLPLASKGGGSLRGALEATEEDVVTFADDGMLSILTQSGSSLGVKGLAERAGLGTEVLVGGLSVDCAG
jgi:hypothetical protein